MYGHLDEILQWDQAMIVQKLNALCLCDSLAKRALAVVIVNSEFIGNTIPFEGIILQYKNKKEVESATKALYP